MISTVHVNGKSLWTFNFWYLSNLSTYILIYFCTKKSLVQVSKVWFFEELLFISNQTSINCRYVVVNGPFHVCVSAWHFPPKNNVELDSIQRTNNFVWRSCQKLRIKVEGGLWSAYLLMIVSWGLTCVFHKMTLNHFCDCFLNKSPGYADINKLRRKVGLSRQFLAITWEKV